MLHRKKIVLVGGGGHTRVIIDAIKKSKGFSIYGAIDPGLVKDSIILGVRVIGSDEVLPDIFKRGINYAFISVGSIGNCDTRKRIYQNLKRIGFQLPVIKHPKTIIARDVELEEGAFVAGGVVINTGVKIGKNAIINTSASIDHDCIIGDFVHVAPGVTLSGGVKIGDETHLGTGANIIQHLNIGKRCIIGAGTTVRHDMVDNEKKFGKYAAVSYEKE